MVGVFLFFHNASCVKPYEKKIARVMCVFLYKNAELNFLILRYVIYISQHNPNLNGLKFVHNYGLIANPIIKVQNPIKLGQTF